MTELSNALPLTNALERLARSRGDTEAWGSLYVQLWPFVMAQNYRHLRGRRDLAEDASQDVFYRLISYCVFDKLDTPPKFYSYVRVVCVNVTNGYLARMRRWEEAELDLIHIFRATPNAATSDSNRTLRIIIDGLKDSDRQVLTLLCDGLALPQIAERTGLSYSNVGVKLHRLKKKVCNLLQTNELSE